VPPLTTSPNITTLFSHISSPLLQKSRTYSSD
jgi:hypothetical protein